MLEHRLHARCGCAAHAASSAGAARPFAFSSTPRHFERDRPFSIEKLSLDLTLEVATRSISATARLDVRRIDPDSDAIELDAIGFTLREVTVDGAPAKHRYDGRILTVTLGKRLSHGTITVKYAATPRRGLYFLEPDEHVPSRPKQVWSQCQEEDARHFLPVHDKPHVKMKFEAKITVPNGWSVLSNGVLVAATKPKTGNWRFHWKMDDPLPSYLLTIVAGEFTTLEADADGIPLTYVIPKGRDADGKRTFERTPDMVKFFGKRLGVKFPWNKYAQVVVSDFIFGGMENTTATTMYEYILLDERASMDISSDDLISHELAHHWFGDFVTCRDWSEGWLNEGFATYMEHVWREEHLGKDEYEYGLKGDLDGYTGEAAGRYRRPIVCQDYDAPLDLFDRHLYEKGAMVLHGLRTELGTDLFWKGVSTYLARHAHGVVETRDLMRAMEEVSGRSLGRFFEEAVYKPGHVELEVSITWNTGILVLDVKQTQSTHDAVPNVFHAPLVLDVVDERGGSTRHRVKLSQRAETFALPMAKRPAFVVVDPDMRILGDVTVKGPLDMLRTQLAEAKTARGRWLAAAALARSDDPPTLAALGARLRDEKEFWGVRGECAEALAKIRGREAEDILLSCVKIKHPKVRRTVVAALGHFKSLRAAEALKSLALRDPSYLVEAEAARALGKTKQNLAFDVLVDVVDRPSWADIVAVGAIDGLAALREDRATPHVLARTRYGHPTRKRRAAIMAVPKLAADRRAREALEDLLEDSDPSLRVDVARALADLGDLRSRPALRNRLEVDLDPRVRRRIREVLRDLGGEGKRGTDQLREDFDKLTGEHAELKARMAKLEAKVGGKKRTTST
jgi:aminopeptidase N